MTKKGYATGLIAVFVAGTIIGGLGGALFVTGKTLRVEADAMMTSVADSAFSLVPLLLALDEDDAEKKIELAGSAARSQLTAAVVVMHTSLPLLSEEKKSVVEGVLRSVAAKRERLKLGEFAQPARHDIAEMLAVYES